ncbi:Pre-toxin TG domain-containing protein [Saccharibacillus brassicae]
MSYIAPFGLSADGATWWETGLSFAADATPFVETLKGIQEVFSGVDLITGQQMSVTDRVATGVGTAASLIPFGKHIGKYLAKEGIEGGAWLAGKLGKESKASRLLNGCNCFTAGTQVKTDQGDKNIEDIQVGDLRVETMYAHDAVGQVNQSKFSKSSSYSHPPTKNRDPTLTHRRSSRQSAPGGMTRQAVFSRLPPLTHARTCAPAPLWRLGQCSRGL